MRKVPANMVYAAKNFAQTIEGSDTGADRSSCSVLSFFSSLNNFIVSNGMTTIKT